MGFPQGIYRGPGVVGGVILIVLLAANLVGGASLSLESAGARGGFSTSSSGRDFHSAEITLNANLPWSWNPGGDWHVQTRLDSGAGWLGNNTAEAAMIGLGPSALVRFRAFPVSLEAGSSPTVLTEHGFGRKNLGTWIQFASHGGLNWDVTLHWRLGYRFEHISNAGLAKQNPGLNMSMVSVSYLF